MYDHLTAISAAMNQLGWSNYANDHEDGNGQFEQNFQFADALTTADRVVTLRYLLSMIAAERGMVATFMPKPFADRTGSGLHLHLSLTSGGTPVFPADEDERGLGLSRDRLRLHRRHPRPRLRAAGRHRANGQLLQANRRDHHGVRRVVGAAARRPTAATTAPTTSASPTRQRIELRGGDGSANPYLADRRGAGRGHRRHQAQRRPRRRRRGHGRSSLPPTLLHAVDELEADPVVTGVLDAAGDGVAAYFADHQARGVLRLPQRRHPVGDRPAT